MADDGNATTMTDKDAITTGSHPSPPCQDRPVSTVIPQVVREETSDELGQDRQSEDIVNEGSGSKSDDEKDGISHGEDDDDDNNSIGSWKSEDDLLYGDGHAQTGRARAAVVPTPHHEEMIHDDTNAHDGGDDEHGDDEEDLGDIDDDSFDTYFRSHSDDEPASRDSLAHSRSTGSGHADPPSGDPGPYDALPILSADTLGTEDDDDSQNTPHTDAERNPYRSFYDGPYAGLYGDLDGDMPLGLDEWWRLMSRLQSSTPRATRGRHRPMFTDYSDGENRTQPVSFQRPSSDVYEDNEDGHKNVEEVWLQLSENTYEDQKRGKRRALLQGTYPLEEPVGDDYDSECEPDPIIWEEYFGAYSEALRMEDSRSTHPSTDDSTNPHDSADVSTTNTEPPSEVGVAQIQFLPPFTDHLPPPDDGDSSGDEDYPVDDFDDSYDSNYSYDDKPVPGEGCINFMPNAH